MHRMIAVALLALAFVPAAQAQAQGLESDRIAITPTVGYRLSQTHDFRATVSVEGQPDMAAEVGHRLESGLVLGADVAVRLTRSISLIGGVMRSDFPGVLETVTVEDEVFQTLLRSGSLLIAKGGLALRIPEQGRSDGPRSAVIAALARVRRSDPFFAGGQAIDNWALNLGWKAEVPVLPRLSAYLSAEDVITKWNDGELTRRYQAANVPLDEEELIWTVTDISSSLSHILVARIGVSLRF